MFKSLLIAVFLLNTYQLFAQDITQDLQSTLQTYYCLTFCNDGRIYLGSSDGLFLSTDDGIEWNRLPLNAYFEAIYSVAIDSNGYIFAGGLLGFPPGGTHGGLYRSTDEGETWELLSNGIPTQNYSGAAYLSMNIKASGEIFVGAENNQGVFVSTDSGDSWANNLPWDWGHATSIKFNSQGTVFTGNTAYRQVLRSTDNGLSWAKLDSGITGDFVYTKIQSLCITTGDTIIITANNWLNNIRSKVYVSVNSGEYWQPRASVHDWIWDMEIAPNGFLYAVTGIVLTAETVYGRILRSTDEGYTWDTVYTNSIPGGYWCFLSIDGKGNIYARLNAEILKSTDNGITWTPMTIVGVYEQGTKTPISFSLSQNFPNPFNSTTIINYSVLEAENIQLKVYNIMGSEIRTLVNEFKQAGNYKMSFDGSSLASGIYFYKLIAGNYSETRKMILLK